MASAESGTKQPATGAVVKNDYTLVRHVDEVKNQGLVACRDFAVGDNILAEDEPLARLLPDRLLSYQDWLQPGVVADSSSGGSLIVPDGVEHTAKFRAMVQIVLHLLETEKKPGETGDDVRTTEQLLDLYHPTVHPPISSPSSYAENDTSTRVRNDEQGLVTLSQQVLDFVKENHRSNHPRFTPLRDPVIMHRYQRMLLVWACNAFDGGRIYRRISRANHSCHPNATIQTNDDGDRERIVLCAIAPIAKGTEITLSYLAPPALIWAGTMTRQRILQRDKGFTCHCERCCSREDFARAVPCPNCHRPATTILLDEDIQYDDEQTVHYVDFCTSMDAYAMCAYCQNTPSSADQLGKNRRSVESKIETYIMASSNEDNDNHGDEGSMEEAEALHNEYTQLASSVLGSLHWTTHVLLHRTLERDLSRYHKSILTGQEASNDDLASCIDLLQRLYRFTDRQQLLNSSSMLQQAWLCDVTVGVARALVGLGDIRSQRYAEEWVTKIRPYVDQVEAASNSSSSSGLQKVVAAIASASGEQSVARRQKTSDDSTGNVSQR